MGHLFVIFDFLLFLYFSRFIFVFVFFDFVLFLGFSRFLMFLYFCVLFVVFVIF